MNVAEQRFDCAELTASWPENLRRAREVVHDGDRKDFDGHLLLDFAASPFVLVRLTELGDGVVILICELPPLGTKLANIVKGVFLDAFFKRCQLFVD